MKYNRSKILHLNQHQAPLQILHYGSNVCKLNGHKAWGSLLHYWPNDTQLRMFIVVVSCKPVCFVFERARTPRHFLLGKGHRLGYCKILLLAFQGHQGNDQGHGGKRLCCLHVVYSRCLKNVCKYCLLHDPSITTHCRMQKVPCSTMHVNQLCPPFWESILFCTFIVPNWRTS